VLPIDRIQPYERNPRHGSNPEYDRIKTSICAAGLDQPLVITQRPGASDYIVHAGGGGGGNTRLPALKSLYSETGEERFSTTHCLFRPWHGESQVLLAHLRENDLRGGLSFIDKALAIFDIKVLLEQELDTGPISQRDLQTALIAGGYALSEGLISRMAYAAHTLLPLMPQALYAGLGKPQVERIRALDRAAGQIWQHYEPGDEAAYKEVFTTLCRRYDNPDWDTELLRGALETEIAEQADVSIHGVRVELDAQLAGRTLKIPEQVDDSPFPTTEEGGGWLGDPASGPEDNASTNGSGGGDADPEKESRAANSTHGANESIAQPQSPSEPPSDLPGLPDPPVTATVDAILSTASTDPTDLKSLRARAWTLAARLAQRNGIGSLVVPLSNKGLGFTLCDVPDPALADQLDPDTLSQLSLVWWQLAACAELTVAPAGLITAHLIEGSVLHQVFAQQNRELLFKSVWTLDPGQTGYRLWRSLGDSDWHDLLSLMDTYRRIYRLAEANGLRLWA
jgi:ParB family protein of integrating conjugative element (PFGI_1 class)